MSTDRYGGAQVLVDLIALGVPTALGAVWIARMVDHNQPRHRELTRVCGLLFFATLLYIPAVQAQIDTLSEDHFGLAHMHVLVGRCLVLLAAGEYLSLGGRLSSRPLLVSLGRPLAAAAVITLLTVYAFAPMRSDPDGGDTVFNVVYGCMAAAASGTVFGVAAWARRQAISPEVRRSLNALVWASALGLVYGLLAAASANLALVRFVAAGSLVALAFAGVRAVLRHQRLRRLGD
ncbi:hypothetical protein [Antrihabitans sp. YC2-6]|uniref:hypothetical protein n=1 Tax=Antrihabitans sp. YC2-6 TaxID=2799498 RepID=UPI0018F3D73F|nr:hypothetical protein [Antrihabitans sp. YC2-6]MBJ8344276.1 hypothetical protein [Antrihabitans sp. YC2-6]